MKKTRRLVMLALALVLTFAMATTTTFAWFTVNDIVTVGGISGTATATEGLSIRNEDGSYRAYYQFSDMSLALKPATPSTASIDMEGARAAVAPVIGTTGLTDIIFYGADGIALAGGTANANAYLVKEFFFRLDVAMDVAMTSISIAATPATSPRYVTAPAAIAENAFGTHDAYALEEQIDTELLKAIRIALFDDEGTLIAVYHLVEAEGGQDFDDDTSGYNMAGYLYKQYFNLEPITTDGIDDTANLTLTTIENNSTAAIGADDQAGVTLIKGTDVWYESSMTVVIWIEGTDGDCINSVINDSLAISLIFTGSLEG